MRWFNGCPKIHLKQWCLNSHCFHKRRDKLIHPIVRFYIYIKPIKRIPYFQGWMTIPPYSFFTCRGEFLVPLLLECLWREDSRSKMVGSHRSLWVQQKYRQWCGTGIVFFFAFVLWCIRLMRCWQNHFMLNEVLTFHFSLHFQVSMAFPIVKMHSNVLRERTHTRQRESYVQSNLPDVKGCH